MKKFICTLFFSTFFLAQAQVNHLVMSQVYSGGGNTGSPLTHDFVELYNPTNVAISLAGMSVQYAGPGTNNWSTNIFNLTGSVAAGRYFLIQFGSTTGASNLPRPDLKSNAITLSTASGKVALVSNTTVLTNNCPLPNSFVIDFVGYGAADCFETVAAPAPSNTTSISRAERGCVDANNNSTDFVVGVPSPRNSASDGHTCNSGFITIAGITPNPFCISTTEAAQGSVAYSANGTFANSTFSVYLSNAGGSFASPLFVGSVTVNATNPSGAIPITIPAGSASATTYRFEIHANAPALLSAPSDTFEIINGAKNIAQSGFKPAANNTTITLNWINPLGCFDEVLIVAKEGSSITGSPSGDGSAYTADLNFTGTGTPFNGGKVVYRGTTPGQTVTNLTNGVTYFFKAYVRRGTSWSSGTEASEHPRVVPAPGEIVINQVSPDYNTTLDEYIELVNLTDNAFDLADVSIEIRNSPGANVVAGGRLSGIMPPHAYCLILPKTTSVITVGKTSALAADINMDLGFANTNNQLGLVRLTDGVLLDGVAYGTISTKVYAEGTPVANPPTDGGLKRKISGADANNNQADFTGVGNTDIELRNSNSRLANANARIIAGNYATLEVTGNASLAGDVVVNDKLILTNGLFSLGNQNLTTKNAVGGRTSCYIKTDGSGALVCTKITSDVIFPIGNSTYNPVTISNGAGLDWLVSVQDALLPTPTPFPSNAAILRTWNITPSAIPATGATVVFEYNDADATQTGRNFAADKSVVVWNYHAGSWKAVTMPQKPVTIPGRKAVTLTNYSLFSPFAISNNVTALPVRFIQFSARLQTGGVLVQFTNATEKDVVHYTIERSANGVDFTTMAELAPKSNNGEAGYQWLDKAPLAGQNWYRVKSLETNGTITFTTVLQVSTGHYLKKLTVYPNPVRGRSVLWQATLPQGVYTVRVYNMAGQPVFERVFNYAGGHYTETFALPQTLAPGTYRLHVANGAFVQQQAFIIL